MLITIFPLWEPSQSHFLALPLVSSCLKASNMHFWSARNDNLKEPFHFPPCFPGFVWRHHLNHLFHCPSITLERAPDFVYNTCKTRKISESSWPWSHRTWKKRHEISWWLSISCQLGSVRLCWTLLTVSSGGGRQYHPVMQCGWI